MWTLDCWYFVVISVAILGLYLLFCLNTWVLKHLALALWLRAIKIKLCLKVQSWSMKIVCWLWIAGQDSIANRLVTLPFEPGSIWIISDSKFNDAPSWEAKVPMAPWLYWLHWSQPGPFQVLLSGSVTNNTGIQVLISVGDVPTGNASWYIFVIKSQFSMIDGYLKTNFWY